MGAALYQILSPLGIICLAASDLGNTEFRREPIFFSGSKQFRGPFNFSERLARKPDLCFSLGWQPEDLAHPPRLLLGQIDLSASR